MGTQGAQNALGNIITGATTNVDIVFVIDATISMEPILNTVKKMALDFHERLKEGLAEVNKSFNQLRIKVIAFRDYYVDGEMAVEESDFFYLTDSGEADKFSRFVSKIEAKGGGDIPESGLEALSLAMRSDWETSGNSRRHIIVLFTDAPAHPLEMQKEGIPNNYPLNMFDDLDELLGAWGNGNQGICLGLDNQFRMDHDARRLVLFTPRIEPWITIKEFAESAIMGDKEVKKDSGAQDIGIDEILRMLSRSMK